MKELHSSEDGDFPNAKNFASKFRTLTDIRHRNIIKLYSFCLNPRHLFLAYQFLEGANLHKILKAARKKR